MRYGATVLTFALACFGQQSQFEVATLKRSPPPQGPTIDINLGRAMNGKVTLGNATLSDCIKFAYGLAADAQLAGPDWINSRSDVRFDVVGQAPPDTSREQLLLMLRNLLAERLKLQVHRENRDLPHLALVRGRNQLKLTPSTAAEGTPGVYTGPGKIINPRISMETLVMLLSRFERQTIVDRTELSGFYQLKLEWTPERVRMLPPRPDGSPVMLNGIPADGPSLATAIQEQLGLKLESRKGPIEVLVVDHAEQTPAAN